MCTLGISNIANISILPVLTIPAVLLYYKNVPYHGKKPKWVDFCILYTTISSIITCILYQFFLCTCSTHTHMYFATLYRYQSESKNHKESNLWVLPLGILLLLVNNKTSCSCSCTCTVFSMYRVPCYKRSMQIFKAVA